MKYLASICAVIIFSGCGDKPKPATPPVPPALNMDMETNISKPAKPPRISLSTTKDDYDIKNFSKDNAKFVGLVDGEDIESAEQRIRAYFAPQEPSEGKQSFSYEKTYESNGLTRVVASVSGVMDDSVQAEQFIAYFKPLTPQRAILDSYGMRFKCRRGPNKGNWTKQLCP